MKLDRSKKSLLASVAIHVVVLGCIGLLGVYAYKDVNEEPIYQVSVFGGSAAPAPVAQNEPTPPEDTVRPPTAEDIVDKKDEKPKPPVPKPDQSQQTKQPSQNNNQQTNTNNTGTGINSNANSAGTGTQGDGTAAGAGQGEASNEVQRPAVPPSVRRSAKPEYPAAAFNKKITGTTYLRILIGKDGGVESVSVGGSSGDSSLDNAAVSAGRRMRFNPGLDQYGRPVRCYANIPIVFNLK